MSNSKRLAMQESTRANAFRCPSDIDVDLPVIDKARPVHVASLRPGHDGHYLQGLLTRQHVVDMEHVIERSLVRWSVDTW